MYHLIEGSRRARSIIQFVNRFAMQWGRGIMVMGVWKGGEKLMKRRESFGARVVMSTAQCAKCLINRHLAMW